jgi:hypothetical protein
MSKIYLNESHIRQLVRETLENLILGEDDIENESPELPEEYILNIINSIENWEVYEMDFDHMVLLSDSPNEDYITLNISYNFDIKYGSYDKGDYWTPPYQEENDIDNFQIYDIEYELNDTYTGSIATCPKDIEDIVINNIYEEINNGDYWERNMDL